MKQLILLILSAFISPVFEPEPNLQTSNLEKTESVYLEEDQRRIPIEINKTEQIVMVSNLQVGSFYSISITGNETCQTYIGLNGQQVIHNAILFKAKHTYAAINVRVESTDSACLGTYWLSVFSKSQIEEVEAFSLLDVTASSNSPVCEGADIELMSDVSNGTPPFTFSWTGPSGFMSNEQNPVITDALFANGGLYTVMVTDSLGDTGSAEVDVDIDNSPEVFANCTFVCEGGDLQFFAEAQGGVEPYTFAWTGPNGFTSDIEDPIIMDATAANSGTYTLIVTDQNGCSSLDTYEAEVFASLDLTASANSPVCVGGTIELMAVASNGTPPYSFSWTGPNGFSSTEQNPVINGATTDNAGVYIVMASDSTGSCAGETEVEVIVSSSALSVTASSNGLFCVGGNIQLMSDASGGTPPYSYSWTGPNGFTSTDQNPVITGATAAESGVYVVMVTDSLGCSGGAETSVDVSNQALDVTASSNSPICEGQDIELMSSASGGIPPYSYSWTGPNGFTSTDQNPIITGATTTEAGLYTIMVTDSLGCSGSAETEVEVVAGLDVTASSNSPICEGQDIELMSSASGGTAPYTYSWTGPNGFTSTDQNPIITGATTTEAGVYTVMVTDSLGCSGSAETVVEISGGLMVSASSNSFICVGDDLMLMSDVMGGTPPYSFNWSGPNGFTSTDQNPTITGATAAADGVYTVTVTDSLGCEGSAEVDVRVNEPPMLTASSNSPICEGDTLKLFAEPMGGLDPYSFDWTGPNGFVSTDQNPIIADATVAAGGTYTVILSDENGCMTEASVDVEVFSGD